MHTDPTIQVVHDALAFTTAAVNGAPHEAHAVARRALATDVYGFVDAVISTVQALADDAIDAGADVDALLREIGLGIHLAELAEQADELEPGAPATGPTTGTDLRHQH